MELARGEAEARRISDGFASDAEAAAFWAEGTVDAGERELKYPGADGGPCGVRGTIRGRARGTLLYMHGGGWCGGSIALNHRACRALSAQSGWDVVSISYRLGAGAPLSPRACPIAAPPCEWLAAERVRILG